jgi:hypothetical protein
LSTQSIVNNHSNTQMSSPAFWLCLSEIGKNVEGIDGDVSNLEDLGWLKLK